MSAPGRIKLRVTMVGVEGAKVIRLERNDASKMESFKKAVCAKFKVPNFHAVFVHEQRGRLDVDTHSDLEDQIETAPEGDFFIERFSKNASSERQKPKTKSSTDTALQPAVFLERYRSILPSAREQPDFCGPCGKRVPSFVRTSGKCPINAWYIREHFTVMGGVHTDIKSIIETEPFEVSVAKEAAAAVKMPEPKKNKAKECSAVTKKKKKLMESKELREKQKNALAKSLRTDSTETRTLATVAESDSDGDAMVIAATVFVEPVVVSDGPLNKLDAPNTDRSSKKVRQRQTKAQMSTPRRSAAELAELGRIFTKDKLKVLKKLKIPNHRTPKLSLKTNSSKSLSATASQITALSQIGDPTSNRLNFEPTQQYSPTESHVINSARNVHQKQFDLPLLSVPKIDEKTDGNTKVKQIFHEHSFRVSGRLASHFGGHATMNTKIKDHGGSISTKVTRDLSALLVRKLQPNMEASDVIRALELGVPVLSCSFITDSIDAQKIVTVSKYRRDKRDETAAESDSDGDAVTKEEDSQSDELMRRLDEEEIEDTQQTALCNKSNIETFENDADVDFSACSELLSKVLEMDESIYLREPVDTNTYKTYLTIIQRPMCLNDIAKKLNDENGGYRSIEEFAEDLQLVFSNCMTFNCPSSDIHYEASILLNYTNETISRISQTGQVRWKGRALTGVGIDNASAKEGKAKTAMHSHSSKRKRKRKHKRKRKRSEALGNEIEILPPRKRLRSGTKY